MKTTLLSLRLPTHMRTLFIGAAISGAFSASMGAAQATAPQATPEAKTHVLFIGADLAIERDAKIHRVQDVTGTSVTIEADGKSVQIQQGRRLAMRVNERLKVADRSVSMGKLVVERAYTPEKDPFREFVNSANAAAGQAAMQDLAWGQTMAAEQNLAAARSITDPAAAAAEIQKAEAALKTAEQTNANTSYGMYSSQNNMGTHANQLKLDEGEENFDAIRVTMEFTPAEDLLRPYYVVIAQIRERDSKSNTARKWIYTRSLDALQAGETRKVTLLEGGFPTGYLLENYSVHLYDRGQEVATNFSRKRVELTTSEAYDYQVIEYVGANKGKTVPAALISTSVSGPMRNQLRALVDRGVFVRVMKDGKVGGVFHDADGKRPMVDENAQAALQHLRFTPALKEGRLVEETIRLKWSDSSS